MLNDSLIKSANLVNKRMVELLPNIAQFSDSKLAQAMHYSAIAKGKKIRPFLVLTTAEIFGANQNAALNIACALEFIHIYSLIHDDLPAMDDDDFRRGEPSCHKKFDEATAILAGDALLTYAFEILSDENLQIKSEIKCQLINLIAKAIGFNGMAGGQMMDLEAKNKTLSLSQIFKLHNLKTGKMFIAAILSGAVLGEADSAKKTALTNYATDIGLAFQIKDDILDFEEHQDKRDPASIVNLSGLENAISQLNSLKISALKNLEIFDEKADLLRELVEFIIERKN